MVLNSCTLHSFIHLLLHHESDDIHYYSSSKSPPSTLPLFLSLILHFFIIHFLLAVHWEMPAKPNDVHTNPSQQHWGRAPQLSPIERQVSPQIALGMKPPMVGAGAGFVGAGAGFVGAGACAVVGGLPVTGMSVGKLMLSCNSRAQSHAKSSHLQEHFHRKPREGWWRRSGPPWYLHSSWVPVREPSRPSCWYEMPLVSLLLLCFCFFVSSVVLQKVRRALKS